MGKKGLRWCGLLAAFCVLASAGVARAAHELTVAQDGTGDYTSVQAAINALPARQHGRATIFIKAGTYQEKIVVPMSRPRLTLIGEDRDTTIITDSNYTLNRGDDPTNTPTVTVLAKDFAARNLTFSNTAGDVGQASFAMWVQGSRARFHHCAILGYQDTLYLPTDEAYFKDCFIEGAVDFIFGSATAVFKGCTIHCIGSGYITAANTTEDQPYGFVFKGCTIYGDAPAGTVYLGRAWGEYANVTYINCVMDDEIAPEGWDDFGDPDKEATAFYAEYANSGPGASTADRVDWSRELTDDENKAYTLDEIFHLTATYNMMLIAAPAPTPWYGDY